MTFDRKFDSLFVLFLRPWLPWRVLFKQWKQSFLLDEMLYILFLFHSTETNGTFFCVVVLLLVKYQRFIGWQNTSPVTLLQLYLVSNFMPQISHRISRAMTAFKCSYREASQGRVWFICSLQTPDSTFTLKDLFKRRFWSFERMLQNHIRRCWGGIGFFDETGDSLTICPLHRDEFGLGWRPSKAYKHPLHGSKQKPVRGVTLRRYVPGNSEQI